MFWPRKKCFEAPNFSRNHKINLNNMACASAAEELSIAIIQQKLADWYVDSETEVWSGTLKVNFGKDLKQSFG